MQTVILKPLQHRGQECIGIYFENYTSLNTIIRKQAGAKWSQSNKCWYVPLSKENYNKLFFALKGKAETEQSALHQYLADKKNKKRVSPANNISLPKTATSVTAKPEPLKQTIQINKSLLQKPVTIYKTGKRHLVTISQGDTTI